MGAGNAMSVLGGDFGAIGGQTRLYFRQFEHAIDLGIQFDDHGDGVPAGASTPNQPAAS